MASETGIAQTGSLCGSGVVGQATWENSVSRIAMESRTIEGDSPVDENAKIPSLFLSRTGHVKPRLNLGRPLSKAKYFPATDSVLVP